MVMPNTALRRPDIKKLMRVSTIDGMSILCSLDKISKQIAWLVFIALSFVGLVALCAINFIDYVSYSVRTKIDLDVPFRNIGTEFRDLLIPDLGFCHFKTIKKSVYHHDEFARMINFKATLTIYAGNRSNFMEDFNRFCPPPSEEADDFQEPVNASLLINRNSFADLIKFTTQITNSRYDHLIHCEWKGMKVACNEPYELGMFRDIHTDDSLCFLFHYEASYINKLIKNQSFIAKGPISKARDLRLLIDLKQYQRCGNLDEYRGEGMVVSPTSKHTLFHTILMQKNFLLHPGYAYSVKIKVLIVQRLTEHLGRCSSKLYHSTDVNAMPLEYSKTTCMAVALVKDIFASCKCVIVFPSWARPYVNEKNLGFAPELYPSCSDNFKVLNCMLTNVFVKTRSSFSADNNQCSLDPCVEIRYFWTVLSLTKLTRELMENFKVNSSLSALQSNLSVDEWIRRNIILLEVDFVTEKVDMMTEIQVFTFIDLIFYIGSNSGLFFGLSYTSFFELIYIALIVVMPLVDKALGSRTLSD